MTMLLAALLLSAQDPVRDAARRGLEHLKHAEGSDDLVLWTLVSADVPLESPAVHERLNKVLQERPATTLQAALRAMTVAQLDARKYQAELHYCAQFFADNQAVDGLWNDGKPIEAPLYAVPRGGAPPAVAARRTGPAAGDVANARRAAEGMLACRQGGIVFAEALTARAERAWRIGERDAGELAPGLAALLELQAKNPRQDPDVAEAADRLAAAAPPAAPWLLFGWKRTLARLDRAAGPDGAATERALLAAQKSDGSWGPVQDTCGAILLLRRSRR
jgi:hypothetical protein